MNEGRTVVQLNNYFNFHVNNRKTSLIIKAHEDIRDTRTLFRVLLSDLAYSYDDFIWISRLEKRQNKKCLKGKYGFSGIINSLCQVFFAGIKPLNF